MPRFRAVLIFPENSGEARYEFEAPATFMQGSATRIVDAFLNTVDGLDLPDVPVDHEINSANAYRSSASVSVTATGSITFRTGTAVPFVLLISPAKPV
ncbi:hypothetical protein GCM10007036_43600 [Alsobacter metallidurans]|uniref:Uncharacterized protein n=1 Tax=Alsobacter metallidurans TaxID=340221 RepID=A0A917IA59_9HYPH|nr:hypothetical protein [Alsobacter metallidurans]GGH32012.1 hypothetical protein GCM10007036_43600 [Alsobacter metallidurans]